MNKKTRKAIDHIVHKLKCSRKTKKEIKRQLLSEVEDDTFEQQANSLIEEFNSSFSEEEKRAYKKEKCRKAIAIVLILLVVVCVGIWWMLPKQIWLKDSKVFDEEEVLEQAEYVISCLDMEDYQELQKISDDSMKEFFKSHDMSADRKMIAEEWGSQEKIGNVYLVEVSQGGKKSAIVQIHIEYENVSVMYTISFDRDMKLDGLWVQ